MTPGSMRFCVGFVSDLSFGFLQAFRIIAFNSKYKQSCQHHQSSFTTEHKSYLSPLISLGIFHFSSRKSLMRQMRLNANRPIGIHYRVSDLCRIFFSQNSLLKNTASKKSASIHLQRASGGKLHEVVQAL